MSEALKGTQSTGPGEVLSFFIQHWTLDGRGSSRFTPAPETPQRISVILTKIFVSALLSQHSQFASSLAEMANSHACAEHVEMKTVATYDIVNCPQMHLPHNHTTTVLRPFFRDHLGGPVPEENFWTLWCRGRLTEADIQTIWTNQCPPPPSPPFFQAGCPSCRTTNSVKALKAKMHTDALSVNNKSCYNAVLKQTTSDRARQVVGLVSDGGM